jgi:tetratricopeptide (TPR) repeat protein
MIRLEYPGRHAMHHRQEFQSLTLLALLFGSLVLSAQSQQNPPAQGSQQPNPSVQQQQAQGLERQPSPTPMPLAVAISGMVVTHDGIPPAGLVTVRAMCNGVQSSQVPVDSKGGFVVQVSGRSNSPVASASESRNRVDGRLQMTEGGRLSCVVVVRAPGYLPATRELRNLRPMEHPNVGLVVLTRAGKVDGVTVSMVSMEAPPDARKAYAEGQKFVTKQDWDKARAKFEKAVAVYPKHASAWYELGKVYERKQQFADAVRSYRESLAADPKYANPYLRLVALAAQEKKWREVSEWSEKLIRLDPLNFPSAYYFHMWANFNLREFAVAERSARETLKRDEQHRFPKAHHLLGLMLANTGDNAAASEQLKEYLRLAPDATDTALVRKQLAEFQRRLASSPAPGSAQQQ